MRKKIKSGIKKVGNAAKLAGKVAVEFGKRAISPSYTHKKLMGPNFGKKRAK